ncbi:MFS transporter [Pseudomonas sp. B392_1p]|uniref:MFS transporter n=1 Tax=Pseudomonas sp. B392_1p TaxID=3457507 RepID=UPI003FCF36C4
MDALLILGGLLLIMLCLVWLSLRAFSVSVGWGIASLVPPLGLAFAWRHWSRGRLPLFIGALGCVVLFSGLSQLASRDTERLRAILSLQWLQPPQAQLQTTLQGQLWGEKFKPEQGELINGVLRLREGRDFFARRELLIRLPQGEEEQTLRLDILPQDHVDVPVVEISRLLPEQNLPEAHHLEQGYTLHLHLQRKAPNRMVGDLHLALPAPYQTRLTGRVELFTDHLRYREDGQVDTHFDSEDTVLHVIGDYLQRRFVQPEVEVLSISGLDWSAQYLDVHVRVKMGARTVRLPLKMQKHPNHGWQVLGDRYPELPVTATRPPASVQLNEQRLRSIASPQMSSDFSLERLQAAPGDFTNRRLRVQTLRGHVAEGVFLGLDEEGRMQIRQVRGGPGEVRFNLATQEIQRIELLQ